MDVLFYDDLSKMKLFKDQLRRVAIPLARFSKDLVGVEGKITLFHHCQKATLIKYNSTHIHNYPSTFGIQCHSWMAMIESTMDNYLNQSSPCMVPCKE